MIRNSALFGIFFLLFVACGPKDAEIKKAASIIYDLPVEVGSNVSIVYTDSGFLKAKLFAPLLERFASEARNQTEMADGITAYFYDQNGHVTSYIKSKYAVRDERERSITVRNDVNVINNKGDTLRTEELIWDERADRIYSEKFVRITSPDKIIMGSGFESNTAFTKFRVLNITGIISLNK